MATSETKRTIRRIFIASPGDLAEERKRFPRVLEQINKMKAHAMGIHLEPLGWEDTLPGMGRPQGLINKDVEKCDLFIMLLWKRWGSRPAADSPYTSGTEEEYELARQMHKERIGKGPEIYLYFKQIPEVMMADPGEQLRQVLDFRRKVEEERALLFKTFAEREEWEEQLMDHVARWLDGFQPRPTPAPAPLPPEVEQQIRDLGDQLRQLSEKHQDAQSRLREAAQDLGKRATEAWRQGRLTEAEEMFAKSTQTHAAAWIVNAFGLYLYSVGSYHRAIEKFTQVKEIGEAESNQESVAAAQGNLGNIRMARGDLAGAEEMFRNALRLYEQLGNTDGVANSYGSLGYLFQHGGNLRIAEEMFTKSLTLHVDENNMEGMANDYNHLGALATRRGDLDVASEMLHKALTIFEEAGMIEGMAKALGNLGNLALTRGDIDAAENMIRRAIALNERLGRKHGVAIQYSNLGLVFRARGDFLEAKKLWEEAMRIFVDVGAALHVDRVRDLLATVPSEEAG